MAVSLTNFAIYIICYSANTGKDAKQNIVFICLQRTKKYCTIIILHH